MDFKKYKDTVYQIIGAAMEVHSELLINFGQSSLQGERYGYDEETNECILLDKNMRPAF